MRVRKVVLTLFGSCTARVHYASGVQVDPIKCADVAMAEVTNDSIDLGGVFRGNPAGGLHILGCQTE